MNERSKLIGEVVCLGGDVERLRERCAVKDAEIEQLRSMQQGYRDEAAQYKVENALLKAALECYSEEQAILRKALTEARGALATLDHMNGKDDGLAVIRGGKPVGKIIDAALATATNSG